MEMLKNTVEPEALASEAPRRILRRDCGTAQRSQARQKLLNGFRLRRLRLRGDVDFRLEAVPGRY